MPTNKKIVTKGIQYLVFALPLLFIGPGVIHSAFKNQFHPLYRPVLCAGIAISFGAVYLTFSGVKTVVKGIFENNTPIK